MIRAALVIVVSAFALAACGVRGPPRPPRPQPTASDAPDAGASPSP